jgi:hypothetical protein
MAVNYAAALKTTRMTAVKDAIAAGAAAAPKLEICSAAYAAVLATIALDNAVGAVTGDTLDITVPAEDTAADNGGTAAVARIKDRDGNVVVQGLTCGTSGTDIIMPTTTVVAGQVVTLTAASIQHSA